MLIKQLHSPNEIGHCFEAMRELRTTLQDRNKFIELVMLQQQEGYRLIAIEVNDEVVACAGYRFLTMISRGKTMYIDDLSTKTKYRTLGYGTALLQHLINLAKDQGCDQVHLDSNYTRFPAHKLYLNHGFTLNSHHFALNLKANTNI